MSDVYSFGMCLWEIVHEKIPYENEFDMRDTQALYEYLYEHSEYRPTYKLEKYTEHELWLLQLYRMCCNDQVAMRPSFATLSNMLMDKLGGI